MPYIYKIVNDINNKIYIGKTTETITKRWKEHCSDYNKERCEKRPLYNAIKKYGIEHFSIVEIEKVENITDLEDRERYWIEFYGSFKNGYNATIGGDGKPYLDYELIYKTWLKGFSLAKTATLIGCSEDSVKKILFLKGISKEQILKHGFESSYKPVCKIDITTNEVLKIYSSIVEAERENNIQKHIASVCKGKRQTAGGYKWKYLDDINLSIKS